MKYFVLIVFLLLNQYLLFSQNIAEKQIIDSIQRVVKELNFQTDTFYVESAKIDTTEWRILYDGENTDLELSKEEIWQKADTKISHLFRTSEDYIYMAKSCSDTRDGDYLAIYFYTKSIEKNKNCYECFLGRAERQNEYDKDLALADYKNALRLNPKCTSCFLGIGNYYSFSEKKKNFPLSRSYFYKALKASKNDSIKNFDILFDIIERIGLSYSRQYEGNDLGRQKNISIQISILDSIIKSSNLIECYPKRASLKQDIEDYKGALDDYSYYIKNSNDWNYNELWAIAACNYRLGNSFEAIINYKRAIERIENNDDGAFPDNLFRLYFAKATCKLSLEDYRGAIEDFQISILKLPQLDRNNSLLYLQAYSSLGKTRMLMNDFKNAIGDLKKAVEYNLEWTSFVNNEVVKNVDLAYAYYLLGAANYKLWENNSIYSYKDDACKAWSKAGDLGNKEAYTYIKDYCNN